MHAVRERHQPEPVGDRAQGRAERVGRAADVPAQRAGRDAGQHDAGLPGRAPSPRRRRAGATWPAAGDAAAADPDHVLVEQVRARRRRRWASGTAPGATGSSRPAAPRRRSCGCRRGCRRCAVIRPQIRGARPVTPASSTAKWTSGANSQRTRRPKRRPPEVARMVGESAGTSRQRNDRGRPRARPVDNFRRRMSRSCASVPPHDLEAAGLRRSTSCSAGAARARSGGPGSRAPASRSR